jgi:hypothetical protein
VFALTFKRVNAREEPIVNTVMSSMAVVADPPVQREKGKAKARMRLPLHPKPLGPPAVGGKCVTSGNKEDARVAEIAKPDTTTTLLHENGQAAVHREVQRVVGRQVAAEEDHPTVATLHRSGRRVLEVPNGPPGPSKEKRVKPRKGIP